MYPLALYPLALASLTVSPRTAGAAIRGILTTARVGAVFVVASPCKRERVERLARLVGRKDDVRVQRASQSAGGSDCQGQGVLPAGANPVSEKPHHVCPSRS
jgi:hypothetical protein